MVDDKGNGDIGKAGDEVRIQHVDAGQSSMEQIISDQQGTPNTSDLSQGGSDQGTPRAEGEGTPQISNIHSIYIQPNYEGKFYFTNKDFNHSYEIGDAAADIALADSESGDVETTTVGHTEFDRTHFGENIVNLSGSDLAFDKIYFGQDADYGGGADSDIGNIQDTRAGGVELGPAIGAAAATNDASAVAPPVEEPPVEEPPVEEPPVEELPIVETPVQVISKPIVEPPTLTPKTIPIIDIPVDRAVPNTAPEGTIFVRTMLEDSSMRIDTADILANVRDAEGNPITVTSLSNLSTTSGTLTSNSDGSWQFTPNENFNGNIDLRYTVSDGKLSSSQKMVVEVLPVNDAPTGVDHTFSGTEGKSVLFTKSQLLAGSHDVDGDTLDITNVSYNGDQGTLVDPGNGNYIFVPKGDFDGQVDLTYTISDGELTTTNDISINIVTGENTPPIVREVNLTMFEDKTITITTEQLLANASDLEGDNLTVTELSTPSGTLVDNGDGTWAFTPNLNFNGDLNLQFTVSDGQLTTPQSLHITVLPVNDAPVVSDIEYTMLEDGSLIIKESELLSNITDVEGDTVSIVNLTSPQGDLINNNDGTYTFTPAENFNGSVNLSLTVTDGTATVTSPVSVNVLPVNDLPVAQDLNVTSTMNVPILITSEFLLSNAYDVDGDNLTVTSVINPYNEGSIVDNGDGTWTYNPPADFFGTVADIPFTVSDGTDTITKHINIDIAQPEESEVNMTVEEDGSLIITESSLLENVPNALDDLLSISDITSPNGTIVNNGDGTWTFTPTPDFNGSVDLSFSVLNGGTTPSLDVHTLHVDVLPVNDAPVVNPVNLSMGEDSTIIINESDLLANASDIDSENLSVGTISSPQGSLVNNNDGTWSFTPDLNFNGDVTLEFTVSDGELTTPAELNITVTPINDSPEAAEHITNMLEDHTLLIKASDLLEGAYDVEGDSLSVASLTVGNGEGRLVDNGDGTWSFTPAENFNGDVDLHFTLSDGTDVSAEQTYHIKVAPVNDAPDALDKEYTIQEDGSLIISPDQLLSGASDIDGDNLNISDISYDGTDGILYENGDGTWTFAPNENFNGDVNLSFTVSDGLQTTTNNIHVNVTPVNDAPIGEDKAFTMLEDGSLTITDAQLLANASDVDGDALSIVAVNYSGNDGSLVDNGDGTWSFTPNENFNGEVAGDFTYTLSDGQISVDHNIDIKVEAVNDAPIGLDKSYTIDEDGSLLITAANLLAGATDVENDTLSITNVEYAGSDGTLVDNGDGTWTFTPNENFNGNVDLSYTMSDGTNSVSHNINVDINPVNDAPIALDKSFTFAEDGTITITAAELLAGSSDPDNDTLSVTNVAYTGSDGALVDNGDGTWTFTPNANFNGDVDLNYTVSDGSLEVTKDINLYVTPVNDAPTAANIDLSAEENTPLIITNAELLALANDVDSDNLTITNITAPIGSIVDNGDETWTYTPTQDFNGALDLEFTVSDGTSEITREIGLNVIPYAGELTANVDINGGGTDLTIDVPDQFDQQYTYNDSGVKINYEYSSEDGASYDLKKGDVANLDIDNNEAGDVTVNNFDNVSINLGDGGDSNVTVSRVEAGDISTGSGNDILDIDTIKSDASDTTFHIDTGSGNDLVSIAGNDSDSIFNIDLGEGDDSVILSGKYAASHIVGGQGDDTIIGGTGADTFEIDNSNFGHDTFSGGDGNATDTILLNYDIAINVVSSGDSTWNLIIDGQSATLTSDTAGQIIDNQLVFDDSASGTIVMEDGSSLGFEGIESVDW